MEKEIYMMFVDGGITNLAREIRQKSLKLDAKIADVIVKATKEYGDDGTAIAKTMAEVVINSTFDR